VNGPSPFSPQRPLLEREEARIRSQFKALARVLFVTLAVVLIVTVIVRSRKSDPEAVPVTPLPSQPVLPALPISPPASAMGALGRPPAAPPLVSSAPNAPATATAGAAAKRYQVVKGDTLERIARRQSVSVASLVQANPGLDPRKLRIGLVLRLPGESINPKSGAALRPATTTAKPAEPPPATRELSYTVKSGDTLAKIARAKGTTTQALRVSNQIEGDHLTVGRKLKLPAPTATPPQ